MKRNPHEIAFLRLVADALWSKYCVVVMFVVRRLSINETSRACETPARETHCIATGGPAASDIELADLGAFEAKIGH